MEFETKEQEKGFLSLSYWLKNRGESSTFIRAIDLFFIQKFHDSTEWVMEVVGNRFKTMENDLKDVQDRLDLVSRELAELRKICENK